MIRESDKRRGVRCRLPAQPPSRAISGSLLTLARACARSPQLRHQMAVLLSHATLESAFPPTKAASLPVYLYWAFSGVTLCQEQMVYVICVASWCVSNFESDALSHLVAGFSALSRPSRHTPEEARNAPPIGGRFLSLDARERVSAQERGVYPGLSLLGSFGGHTCRGADGPHDQSAIIIYIDGPIVLEPTC